ncbi:hypothetical protein IW261DRAFT_1604995 [Armillaria novae-zelandiae]|uniref:F-box domain-containing protein n=1 Tax=Armillaria novae-zelandiae TaxID=153914 RepID=A0AA39UMF2_9AGAR|nr:hypothetical protein IW261DRAFT_1604995 [Armillaria novae-zelandiae]
MVVSTRSRIHSSDCATSTPDARTHRKKRKRLTRQSPQRSLSPSRASLSDLPNELLHKILAELSRSDSESRSVETTIALASTCRRLNEFTMARHFGSDSYLSFGRYSWPFTSFRMLRFDFSKEMTEVQRSLAVLKAMGTDFDVSFEGMGWPQLPTKRHIAFFKDLSKLKCTTIDTRLSSLFATTETGVPAHRRFCPPCLTQLSTVTLTHCPAQYMAWMLRSIKESPVEVLTLHHLSDDTLLKITKTVLSSLWAVMLLDCTFSFAAVVAFLESHQHIKSLDTGTWKPVTSVTGSKGHKKSKPDLKTSFKPATRLSLSSIAGTATAIRALLSTPGAFPSLEQVDIMDGDVTGKQEALLLISHIPSVHHLNLNLQDLNEWLQFKFPHGRRVKRAEELLRGITDFSIVLYHQEVIHTVEIPTVAALILNLERFHTTSLCSEREQLSFVGKMKNVCPGLKMVAVDWRHLYTDPEWLQKKEKELVDQEKSLANMA